LSRRGLPGNADYQLNAINGRSWPHTERLAYTVGDSVRWHVINAQPHDVPIRGALARDRARELLRRRSRLERHGEAVGADDRARRLVRRALHTPRAGTFIYHTHNEPGEERRGCMRRSSCWSRARVSIRTERVLGKLAGRTVVPIRVRAP